MTSQLSKAATVHRPRSPRTAAILFGVASALLVGTASGVANARSTAPAATARVDLYTPSFPNPLNITNPLFPKGAAKIVQTVALGKEPDTKLRFEATQLDRIQSIRWHGNNIKTHVTSFVAYHNGRLVEVAFDYYAQDSKGAVWYFGEDVTNYEHGAVKNHSGTWRAGKDGPPGMIMPGNPKVGDVFRPENAAPVVFEEATVQAVNVTVPGPRGPVHGAIKVRLTILDGSIEDKIFAPRYGEFRAEVKTAGELYNIAVANPIDSLSGGVPSQLRSLEQGASRIFQYAGDGRWAQAASIVDQMGDSWKSYVNHRQVPSHLREQMNDALKDLKATVRAHDSAAARQAGLNVSHATLDLHLRYRSQDSVDISRLAVWNNQLELDTDLADRAGMLGDHVTIGAIKDRIHA